MRIVYYHARCIDGFGAAWSAWRALGDEGVDYRPFRHSSVSYGNIGADDVVYFLDCLPETQEDLKALVTLCRHIAIIDHHKTAIPIVNSFKHYPNLELHIDMKRSGAMMAWNYFHPDEDPPELIQYIQDVDLWNWKLEHTEAATESLRTYEHDFGVWTSLMENPEMLIDEGAALIRYKNLRIEELLSNTYLAEVGGYQVPVINTDSYISPLLNRVCKENPDYPFAAAWNRGGDGMVKWSLRSIGDFDVSEVAAIYGGGGHKNASGFAVPVEYEA
jgi:oligoribonuclease NrnB/cAMP/cGMP phosphodiesterase (DHH superfamily)